MKEYPKEFVERLLSITAKRPATIIQHILQHGFITTAEIESLYGYTHPPRAIRDVKEYGIPIVKQNVKGPNGKTIAQYSFGDPTKKDDHLRKTAGRSVLSKAVKNALIEKYGAKCFIYLQPMDKALLQVDHRIPFEIGGENDDSDIECFMLLSPSANRAKSWTCEHCPNWNRKDIKFCMGCFWAYPEAHTHVAGREMRQIVLTFTGNEIADYERLIRLVGKENAEVTIKKIVKDSLSSNPK